MNPNSTTETYAAAKFQLESWCWAGVPFYIRTGKHLVRNLAEIPDFPNYAAGSEGPTSWPGLLKIRGHID